MTGDRSPALWRALVATLPRRFREVYGADMTATFLARRASARRRGRVAVVRLWIGTTLNLFYTAISERRRSSFDARPAHLPAPLTVRRGGMMFGLAQDVRFATRQLRRQPSHVAFVVLTLAIGIGTNTAVFSVIDGVLLRPLPYTESDRLVAVWSRFLPESGFDFPQFDISVPEYLDYRSQSKTMAGVAAYQSPSGTVTGDGGDAERVPFGAITPNTFGLLGLSIALGRDFTTEDGVPGAPDVIILNHDFWTRRFGADPGIIGRSIVVNGTPRRIVGVAAPGVRFPSPTTAAWRPLQIDPADPGSRSAHGLSAVARLAEGVTFEQARAEMDVLMAGWKAEYPTIHTGHFLFLRPMLEDVVGSARAILLSLFGATGFLLLIVCANVSNIVLARGEARTREMAIRSALGAERRRLLRLTAVESVMLAMLGTVGGVLVAYVGVRVLAALENSGVPRVTEVAVDGRVLAFAVATAVVSAVLFGLVPALRGSAAMPTQALRIDDRTSSASVARLRFRRVLVAAEVAIAVMLVVGAGLMTRSMDRLMAVDPGFDPRNILLANLSLPTATYQDGASVNRFYTELIEKVSATPGVTSATAGTAVPIFNGNGVWDFELEGRPSPAAGAPAWNAAITFAWPGYFETLGLPIVRGRAITPADDASAPTSVVINRALADRFFSGEDPIGKRLRIAGNAERPWSTIVGVSANVRDQSLDEPERPMYYMAYQQSEITAGFQGGFQVLIVKTAGEPERVGASLRALVREMDPNLPLFRMQTYTDALAQSFADRTFATTLFGLFAMLGIGLGATGIYGVLAYSVAVRVPEIGIRRALGASPGSVVRLVVWQATGPVVAGLVVGVAGALSATKFLESQLFGVSRFDVATYLTVALGVMTIALAASLLPARRALRISPIGAMRA